MKSFARLITDLDGTNSKNSKVEILRRYFISEAPTESLWALHLLLGKTKKRIITSLQLREHFLSLSELPEWLFVESYSHVGDTAETISLLLRSQQKLRGAVAQITESQQTDLETLQSVMEKILPSLQKTEVETLRGFLWSFWQSHAATENFVFNKLCTGGFRIGVAEGLVFKALAQALKKSELQVMQILAGTWQPNLELWEELISQEEFSAQSAKVRPFPFCLALSWSDSLTQVTSPAAWQLEWKWDGIRAQLLVNHEQRVLWTRGEDEITAQFPEMAHVYTDQNVRVVLDGELLVIREGQVAPFADLQVRLGRKKLGEKTLKDHPVEFLAYDILQEGETDLRDLPMNERRTRLVDFCERHPDPFVKVNKAWSLANWSELPGWYEQSLQNRAEGLVLKRLDSKYQAGRKVDVWYKHKIAPMTLDAVLLYAQAGSGRRANLFTDYTFALWQGEQLMPFAKAYSGLTDVEIAELDRWIRQHTLEKFGPVRSVAPLQVFEIGFEGIQKSARHKIGLAVRFPRILRWRKDKLAKDADTLETAKRLLEERDEILAMDGPV